MNKSMVSRMVYSMIFLLTMVISSQAQSQEIADGKKVKIDYTLRIDGQEVESSVGKKPLEYVHGQGMLIPGLEVALKGMKAGETKNVSVPPADAYGDMKQEYFREMAKTVFPEGSEFQVGALIQLEGPNGEVVPALIWEVKEDKVIVNLNHPLAGKTLEFDVKVVSIE